MVIQVGSLVAGLGKSPGKFTGDAAATWQALLVLGNGFILTAVLWGWAMVTIIDRRLAIAAVRGGERSARAGEIGTRQTLGNHRTCRASCPRRRVRRAE